MFLLAIYVASQRRQPPAVPTLMPSTVHYHIEAPQQLAATESARQALPIAVQRPLETPIEPPAATPYVAWGNANSTPATAPSSSLATQHNQDSSLVMDAPRVAQRTDRAVASPWVPARSWIGNATGLRLQHAESGLPTRPITTYLSRRAVGSGFTHANTDCVAADPSVNNRQWRRGCIRRSLGAADFSYWIPDDRVS